MDAPHIDTPPPLVLCLVADERVAERCPTSVRYLQIGLIDEAIHTVLVLPETARADSLISGPTTAITYRHVQWPLHRWARRNFIARIQQTIDAMHRDAHVIVHCLAAPVFGLAADLAAALSADLILNLSARADVGHPEVVPRLNDATMLVTPSQRLRESLDAGEIAGKTVECVQYGAAAANVPAAFSSPQLAPAIIYAGALTHNCGAETLLRAAKQIIDDHPNLLVFILGKGPADTALRQLAGSLNLHANVTFTGRLQHWQTALAAADIFCIPSAQAPYREEPVHAFAAGLAVVAPADSLYDGLLDEQTALIFRDRNEAELAQRLRHLLKDHEFARTIAATLQARARSNNSVARMVAEYVRIYRSLQSHSSTIQIPSSR